MVVVWYCFSSCSSSRDHSKPLPSDLLGDHCKPIPNDLLVDILKRLPAEDLLRFQQVCKEWNSLISTPNFQCMHVNYGGAVPTIGIQLMKPRQEKFEVLFLENRVEKCHGILKKVKKSFISSKNLKIEVVNTNKQLTRGSTACFHPAVYFSYHGLLLLKQYRGPYTIFNPITREQFTFQYDGGIYAFFFHPFAKQYYALIRKINNAGEFKLLTLSSLLSNNLDSGKELSTSASNVLPWSSPIVQRDAIYWMALEFINYCCCTSGFCEAAIVIFDIKEEEFHLISHPRPRDSRFYNSEPPSRMNLFEREGLVSFCKFSRVNRDITLHVWDLIENFSWSPRETIILEMKLFPFPYSDWNTHVKVIGTQNGELIINWARCGVFAYNLQLGTLRKLKNYDGEEYVVCVHTKTILSLKSLL